jgi:hypothetical protein
VRRLLALSVLPLVLGACSITDSINDTIAVASVKFSSDDPAYTGPTISGPSTAQAVIDYALHDASYVLGEYNLVLTFHVKADNRGNSHKASFGQTVKPDLNFYISSKSPSNLIKSTMDPFSVEAGQVGSLDFPVKVPLTAVNRTILKQIAAGDSIPYFLTGSITFDFLDATGGLLTSNAGSAEIDLATGKIPTRPASGLNLSDILKYL